MCYFDGFFPRIKSWHSQTFSLSETGRLDCSNAVGGFGTVTRLRLLSGYLRPIQIHQSVGAHTYECAYFGSSPFLILRQAVSFHGLARFKKWILWPLIFFPFKSVYIIFVIMVLYFCYYPFYVKPFSCIMLLCIMISHLFQIYIRMFFFLFIHFLLSHVSIIIIFFLKLDSKCLRTRRNTFRTKNSNS